MISKLQIIFPSKKQQNYSFFQKKDKILMNKLEKISQLGQQLIQLNHKYNRLKNYPRKSWLNRIAIDIKSFSQEERCIQKNSNVLVVKKHDNLSIKNIQMSQSSTFPIQSLQSLRKELQQSSPSKILEFHRKCVKNRKPLSFKVASNKNQDIHFTCSIQYNKKPQYSRCQSLCTRKKNIINPTLINKNRPHSKYHSLNNMNTQDTICFPDENIKQTKKIQKIFIYHKENSSTKVKNHSNRKDYKSIERIQAKDNNKFPGKKMIFSTDIQLNKKNKGKVYIPPPPLTAKSYIICQIKQNQLKPIVMHNSRNSQQIASLTKIMTCILTIEFCQDHHFDIDKEEMLIGNYQSKIGGTSANLQAGQIYTIKQLLFGLMLPSGNDASLALAIWCGRKYLILQHYQRQNNLRIKSSFNPQDTFTKNQCYSYFITKMNNKAKELKMTKTNYMNSHGLININNRSTAFDIAILSAYSMKKRTFREIVSCKKYQFFIKLCQNYQKTQQQDADEQFNISNVGESQQNSVNGSLTDEESVISDKCEENIRSESYSFKQNTISMEGEDYLNNIQENRTKIVWTNTHKLLHKRQEYLGIKTGITSNAGSCLSSCLFIDRRMFIIVVLGCKRLNLRFRQTEILKKWLCRQENLRECDYFQVKNQQLQQFWENYGKQ